MCLGWRFSDSKTCLWNYDSFLGTVGYHPSSGRIFWVNNNKSYHLLGEWIPHMEIWDLYSPHMSPEKCITSSPFSRWDDCYPKRSNSLLKVMEVVSGKADPFSSPPGPSPRAALKGERETVRAPRLGACAAPSCQLFATMHCSPPGSSVREILQAGMLEWAAISFPRGSFQPRDWTCVSYVSCMAGRCFTCRATGEAKRRRYQDTKIRYFRRNQQCNSLF